MFIKEIIGRPYRKFWQADNAMTEHQLRYTDIGHKKGERPIIWYMMPGGKIVLNPDNLPFHNATSDGLELDSIAVGRIDPIQKKISIRAPEDKDFKLKTLSDSKIKYVCKRLEQKYPDYEIWYFGNTVGDYRRLDKNQ